MTLSFTKAIKSNAKLRLALIGPAGSGKTYSALAIAASLGGRVAVLDTEHGSASKYADLFEFDAMEPPTFNPQVYIDAIREADNAGYGVLIIDSLSHAWAGKGGALEMVDSAAKRLKGNSYVAWGEVTPLQTQMVDAMLGANLHIIATMRSKMEYVQEKDASGRTTIRKVGLQPVQREGMEFEFDVVGDITQDNDLVVTKTRCPALTGAVIKRPGKELADTLKAWLAGVPAPATTNTPTPAPPATDQQRWTAFCKEHKYGAAHIEAALGTTSVASWMREQGQLVDDAMNRLTAWADNHKQPAAVGK